MPVYDIGVEGEYHEFVANGIVVHNCYKENLNANNPTVVVDGVDTGRSEGWLTQATIDEKKRSVSAEMFRVEYDLGEPSIGNRAIDSEAVDAMFCLDAEPVKRKESKDFWEYTFEQPQAGATYVIAADWAKEQDYTVINVVRTDLPWRQLAYTVRVNRRPYPVMIGYYNKALRRYRIGPGGAWHDSTGLGNVVNDYLEDRARAFPMTGDKRAKLLNNYVNAIEKRTWRMPKMLKRWYTEHKYCRTGDLYSTAQDYHLPDTVCAGALAEHAASKVVVAAAPLAVPRDHSRPSRITQEMTHPERFEQDAGQAHLFTEAAAGDGFSLVL